LPACEDNPTIARSIEEHFNCDCATDGWDAISKLETGEYAAILIDADVSRHSGYGVITYLREEIGEELGHVIVMTSSDRDGVQRRIGSSPHVVDKADAVEEIARILG
jgi:DNA-binding response OmpR family regulator